MKLLALSDGAALLKPTLSVFLGEPSVQPSVDYSGSHFSANLHRVTFNLTRVLTGTCRYCVEQGNPTSREKKNDKKTKKKL